MKRLVPFILAAVLIVAGIGAAPVNAASPGTYVVRPGDTLTNIAQRYGVSVSRLATVNGLSWGSWVYTGQRLIIPAPGRDVRARTYIVRRGDTLTSIAARFRVSVWRLAYANGLSTSSWVYAGQRLVIPGSYPGPQYYGATYTVQYGDTLYGIARAYGTTVWRIMRANGLRSTTIYAGQQLTVPA